MYIDVHCHLTGDEYEALGGVDEVIAQAKADGVACMICSGFDLDSSYIAKALSEKHPEIYFCAGFHPSELDKYQEGDLDKLKALCQHEKCVAVGEIGLDYHFDDNPPKETQREFFIKQLEIASYLRLPVVIHSRDAAQETLELLQQNAHLLQSKGLMHCYSYSAEMLDEFAKLGLSFSFGGPSTFKNARKPKEAAAVVPLDRLLIETDAPYLAPHPLRGSLNHSGNLEYTNRALAQIKGISEEEMAFITEANARRIFKI